MALSDEERNDAKVEELDRFIAELQKRRRELLGAKETPRASITTTPKKEIEEVKAPAKPEKVSQMNFRMSESDQSTTALEETLNSLQWKSFKKKEGDWTFLRDRDGRLTEDLQSAKDFVDKVRKEGEMVVGRYRYKISEDRFLNRYFVDTNAT